MVPKWEAITPDESDIGMLLGDIWYVIARHLGFQSGMKSQSSQ